MTERSVAPIVAVHLALLVAGAVALSLDPPVEGWAVLGCVVIYLIALLATCRAIGRSDLLGLAAFLALVSVFQVLPDWALVDIIGTLRFPDQGGPRLDDAVPLAMAAMWVPPLFVALALSAGRAGRASLLAGVIFVAVESLAPVLGLWEPVGEAHELLGVAIYVIPAEVALAWAAATTFDRVRHGRLPTRLAAAFAVSTFYLGALTMAHFVIDVARWKLTV